MMVAAPWRARCSTDSWRAQGPNPDRSAPSETGTVSRPTGVGKNRCRGSVGPISGRPTCPRNPFASAAPRRRRRARSCWLKSPTCQPRHSSPRRTPRPTSTPHQKFCRAGALSGGGHGFTAQTNLFVIGFRISTRGWRPEPTKYPELKTPPRPDPNLAREQFRRPRGGFAAQTDQP